MTPGSASGRRTLCDHRTTSLEAAPQGAMVTRIKRTEAPCYGYVICFHASCPTPRPVNQVRYERLVCNETAEGTRIAREKTIGNFVVVRIVIMAAVLLNRRLHLSRLSVMSEELVHRCLDDKLVER